MIIKSFLKKQKQQQQNYQEEEQKTPHIWYLESPWVELNLELNKIKKLQVIPS